MTSLGHMFIVASVILSVAGMAASVWAVMRGSPAFARWTRRITVVVFGFVTAGVFVLLYALLTDDFSFRYVVQHSYRLQPTAYKIAALWSGQQGSLLFWTWLQSGYAALLAWQKPERLGSLQAPALGIMLLSVTFFGGLTAFVASPFEQLVNVPADGRGLNPLLQSFWMISHPVMLYLGFVGFSVPFAITSASLIVRRRGHDWIKLTRRWMMTAWLALSMG